jgi:hypothetical protein
VKHVTFYLPQTCDTNTATQANVESAVILGMQAAGINTSKVDSVWFHCGSFVVLSAFPNEYAAEAQFMTTQIQQGNLKITLNGQEDTATLAPSANNEEPQTSTLAPESNQGGVRSGSTANAATTATALLALFVLVLILLVLALMFAANERRLRRKAESTTSTVQSVTPIPSKSSNQDWSWDVPDSELSATPATPTQDANHTSIVIRMSDASIASDVSEAPPPAPEPISAPTMMSALATKAPTGEAWSHDNLLSWDDYDL